MKLDGKTNQELTELRRSIEAVPANQDHDPRTVWRFTPAARKKLDAIDQQITWNLAQARSAAGNPVVADGYSGRQSNRRR